MMHWRPEEPENYLQEAADFCDFSHPPITLTEVDTSPEALIVNAFISLSLTLRRWKAMHSEEANDETLHEDFQNDALSYDTLQLIAVVFQNILSAHTDETYANLGVIHQDRERRHVHGILDRQRKILWGSSNTTLRDNASTERVFTYYEIALEQPCPQAPEQYSINHEVHLNNKYNLLQTGEDDDWMNMDPRAYRRFHALVAFLPKLRMTAVWMGRVNHSWEALEDETVLYFDENGRLLHDEEVAALPPCYRLKRTSEDLGQLKYMYS